MVNDTNLTRFADVPASAIYGRSVSRAGGAYLPTNEHWLITKLPKELMKDVRSVQQGTQERCRGNFRGIDYLVEHQPHPRSLLDRDSGSLWGYTVRLTSTYRDKLVDSLARLGLNDPRGVLEQLTRRTASPLPKGFEKRLDAPGDLERVRRLCDGEAIEALVLLQDTDAAELHHLEVVDDKILGRCERLSLNGKAADLPALTPTLTAIPAPTETDAGTPHRIKRAAMRTRRKTDKRAPRGDAPNLTSSPTADPTKDGEGSRPILVACAALAIALSGVLGGIVGNKLASGPASENTKRADAALTTDPDTARDPDLTAEVASLSAELRRMKQAIETERSERDRLEAELARASDDSNTRFADNAEDLTAVRREFARDLQLQQEDAARLADRMSAIERRYEAELENRTTSNRAIAETAAAKALREQLGRQTELAHDTIETLKAANRAAQEQTRDMQEALSDIDDATRAASEVLNRHADVEPPKAGHRTSVQMILDGLIDDLAPDSRLKLSHSEVRRRLELARQYLDAADPSEPPSRNDDMGPRKDRDGHTKSH